MQQEGVKAYIIPSVDQHMVHDHKTCYWAYVFTYFCYIYFRSAGRIVIVIEAKCVRLFNVIVCPIFQLLVSSLKAAAAEYISKKLSKLLLGQDKSASGLTFGSFFFNDKSIKRWSNFWRSKYDGLFRKEAKFLQ